VQLSFYNNETAYKIDSSYSVDSKIILYNGDVLDYLKELPDEIVKLVITSPPYNIGKEYEKRDSIGKYLNMQEPIIKELEPVLKNV
jgi:adenine-specific DNA-methyltransferase